MSTKLQREIDQIAFADLLISTWFSHKKTLSFVDISQRLFSQISFTQGEKLPKYLAPNRRHLENFPTSMGNTADPNDRRTWPNSQHFMPSVSVLLYFSIQ